MHTTEQPMAVATAVVSAGAARLSRRGGRWRKTVREFVVIVVSVLAALGAQALWQEHQDRVRERDYLRQILADTRENERLLSAAIQEDSLDMAASVRLMRALRDTGPLPPTDSMLKWIGKAVSSSDFQSVTGTMRALLGSGDLHLLQNDSLRGLIAEHEAMLQSQTGQLRDLRALALNQVPAYVRAVPFLQGLWVVRELRPAPGEIERLRDDPQLRTILFTLQSAEMNRLRALASLRLSTRRLRTALEAEPGTGDAAPPPSKAARR